MKDIITEVINEYLESKCMINEYKNPKDAETIRVCGDQLEALYKRIIEGGVSKNEYLVERLGKAVLELRKLEKQFEL